MIPSSKISSVSSSNHGRAIRTSRIPYIFLHATDGHHNPENATSKVSSAISHGFARQTQRTFGASSDIELRPLTHSSARELEYPPNNGRLFNTEQIHSHVRQGSTSHEHDESEPAYHLMWTPLSLHWVSLTTFGILFVVLLAALELLNHFSRKYNGLSQANPKDYYLWTYGPTAVLSIIGALWAQVEYRVKQLIPWQMLKRGPVHATKSVLLDYVSPWNVISLFKSVKASHYIVTITILATLLIRLLIVFSTGLLLLQDVVLLKTPARMIAFDKFNGDNFNASAVDATPALTVAGLSLLDLTYPGGTTSDYAYQSFNTSNTVFTNTSTLTGSVEAFTADLACEPATLQSYHESCITSDGCEDNGRYLQVVASDCTTEEFMAFIRGNGDPDAFFGSLSITKCLDHSSTEDDARLVLATGRFNPNQSLSFTGLVCKPIYNITTKTVSLHASGSLKSISSSSISSSRSISQVTPWDITAGINSTMSAAVQQIRSWSETYESGSQYVAFDTFFWLLNITVPQQNATSFLNQTLLLDVARRTFSSLGVQVAKQYLMVPATDEFGGSMDLSERRLLVHSLSLRAMEATLAALVVITAAIVMFRPHHISARDPGSLIGASTIFSSSPSFMKSLSMSELISMKTLNTILSERQYQSTVTSKSGVLTFGVEEVSNPVLSEMEPQKDNKRNQDQWWRPFSVTLLARIIIIVIPFALIAALEGIYQASYHHDGIADIQPGTYIHYTWVYIPALVMLGIRAIFDSVDFNTRVLQPYCALRQRSATAERSIFVNYLAKPSIHAICSGIAKQQFAVVLTSATMFVAPFLTIIVSGLFTANNIPQTVSVAADRLDWFNASAISTYNAESADTKPNLVSSVIMETNLDYPQWTSADLVFPKISLAADLSAPGSSSTLEARLPALRAVLNCSIIPSERVDRMIWDGPGNLLWLELDVGTGCGDVGHTNHDTWDWTVVVLNDISNGSYFGSLNVITTNVQGCPTLVAAYGQANGTSLDGLNFAACAPHVDLVEVDTMFSLPTYDLVSTTVDESTASIFANTIDYDNSDITEMLPTPVNTVEYVYDTVFSVLVRGGSKIEPTAITDFMGAGNFPRMNAAISHLYGILYAQKLNFNMRIDAPSTSDSDPTDTSRTIEGILTTPDRTRLQQSSTSTRVLEGLLAAMAICLILSFFLMTTDKVLPLNPCSIAATASLLAGSRMLRPESGVLPPGSEWYDDKALKATKLFTGRTFSLKWWPVEGGDGDGQMRYGVDVDDEDGDTHADGRHGGITTNTWTGL